MGVNRCYSFMKCLLIIFSIIFLVVGCGACGLSAWAVWGGGGEGGGAGGGGAARVALAAVGAWGAVLAGGAALAGAGAAGGRAALLGGGAALLAGAMLAEGGAALWAARHGPQLSEALHRELATLVRQDYGRVGARTDLMDSLQRHLRCCGADGPRDWQTSALDLSVGAAPPHYTVPASCCVDAPDCEAARRVPAAGPPPAGLHAQGCGPRVLAALWEGARAPLAAAAALFAAHAVALVLALALCLRAPPRRYKA